MEKKMSGTYHKQNSNIVRGNSFEKEMTDDKKTEQRKASVDEGFGTLCCRFV